MYVEIKPAGIFTDHRRGQGAIVAFRKKRSALFAGGREVGECVLGSVRVTLPCSNYSRAVVARVCETGVHHGAFGVLCSVFSFSEYDKKSCVTLGLFVSKYICGVPGLDYTYERTKGAREGGARRGGRTCCCRFADLGSPCVLGRDESFTGRKGWVAKMRGKPTFCFKTVLHASSKRQGGRQLGG